MSTPLRTASLLRALGCAIGVIAWAEIAGHGQERNGDSLSPSRSLAAALKQIQQQRQQQPENILLRLREAQHLSWLGRLQSAQAAYREILERLPHDQDARTGYGLTLFWQSDWQQASAAFKEVLARNAQNPLAFNSYLRVLLASGKESTAYQLANERDLQSRATDAELGLLLATMCVEAGADDFADRLASRATQDVDLQRQQIVFRARRMLSGGDHQRALEMIKTFAEAHPDNYQAQVDAADAFTLAGQLQTACTWYERAAAIDPERLEARLGLARLARREGQPHLSLKLYQAIVRENPEALEAWLGVIRTARMLGQTNDAWEALSRAEQIAPRSATLHEEKLRLALATGDATAFEAALEKYERDQPDSADPSLWRQRWLHMREETAEGHGRIVLSAGYEYSAIQNGTQSSDWHEAFASVAWRTKWWGETASSQTLQLEYRRYERFGTSADQLGFALVHGWTKDWLARLEGAVALSGDFIAEWRVGGRVTYRFTDKLYTQAQVNYLNFTDANVWQFVPGLTWHWCPRISSEARLYLSHTELDAGSSDQSVAYYLNTAWEFRPECLLRLHYSIGEENSADLTRNLIGEGNFQSIGADVRFGWEKWAVQPGYRYEWHDRFSLHAVGLAVHYRF